MSKFGLERLVKSVVDSEYVKKTFNNPIYTAILITVILLIIIWVVFRRNVELTEDSSASFFSLMLTTAVYSMIGMLGVMFAQDRVMKGSYETRIKDNEGHAVVNSTLSTVDPEHVKGAAEADLTSNATSNAIEKKSGAFSGSRDLGEDSDNIDRETATSLEKSDSDDSEPEVIIVRQKKNGDKKVRFVQD